MLRMILSKSPQLLFDFFEGQKLSVMLIVLFQFTQQLHSRLSEKKIFLSKESMKKIRISIYTNVHICIHTGSWGLEKI